MKRFFLLCCACGAAVLSVTSCVSAPTAAQMVTPAALREQEQTAARLLALLPAEKQALPAAREEARWLGATVHRGGAAVARVYNPMLSGWLHNRMVNSSFRLRQRGLCWQYQHDLYRELRRRPLHFFRIGCCVLDQDKGAEHHCLYLCEKEQGTWQNGIVFCAWRYSGIIKFYDAETLADRCCKDEPSVVRFLDRYYPEGHAAPMEHWVRVRSDNGGYRDYLNSDSPEGAATRQAQLMRDNCARGVQERRGKATDY